MLPATTRNISRSISALKLEEADPTEQAALGAANTPAYRGTARVVFTQLPLAPYGNRLPNFEFEVVVAGPSGIGRKILEIDNRPFEPDSGGVDFQPVITEFSSVIRVGSVGPLQDDLTQIYDLEGNYQFSESESPREEIITEAVILGGSDPFQVWSVIREDYLAEETRVHIRVEGRHTTFATTARVYTYSVLGEHDLIDGAIPSGEYLGGVIMCADELSFLVLTHNLGADAKVVSLPLCRADRSCRVNRTRHVRSGRPRHAVFGRSV